MAEEFKIHSTYEIDINSNCYLCDLPIPTNVFRGRKNGTTHSLAMHLDHVKARHNGGSNEKANLKETHSYCNLLKNKREWTKFNKQKARTRILKHLKEPESADWERKKNGQCFVEECSKAALEGDFTEYCRTHARELGQKTRERLCAEEECLKHARHGSDYCQTHGKALGEDNGDTKCFENSCKRQVQRKYSPKYCQKHAREKGLVSWKVKEGIKVKAACAKNHKESPNRLCFFCCELNNRDKLYSEKEIKALGANLKLTKYALTKAFKVSNGSLAYSHIEAILTDSHTVNCIFCVSLAKMREDWLP